MESILELLKSYFALALVLVIFSYLMPKEGYKKYMQFFVGILLGVIILRPVAEWIVTDDTPMENLEELTEQLEAIAAENTPKLSPLSISNMNDMMAELVGEEGVIELPKDYQLFILTNNKRIFGVTALCNRKALRELAEKLDSDLLIFPSSVHEIIVKPASGNLEGFLNSRDMVREVNQTLVAQEEILSDSVYFYSKETNTLSIA